VISMETWETIRLRCRRDGEKIKPVARDLALAPNTVRKSPAGRSAKADRNAAVEATRSVRVAHRRADTINAKDHGRSRWELFAPERGRRVARRRANTS